MNEEIKVLKSLKYYDEKNGYYSLHGQYGKQITNSQGKFIVDKIAEGAKLSDLCFEVSKKFNIELCQAKEDVFHFLICLKSSKIINFEEAYFNDISLFDDKVNVVGEREYVQLVAAIKENFKKNYTLYFYPYPENMQHYNEYIIRTNGFYNKENYFFEYDNYREEMKNIIGIMGMSKFDTPLIITLIQFRGEYESLVKFYRELEKKLIHMKKYKIRLSLRNEQINSDVIKFVEEVGFCFEAKLIKEDGIHDHIIYSKLLEG